MHVANLPPHINDSTLGAMFARHGPVASIKIMWPRGEEPGISQATGAGDAMNAVRKAKSLGLNGFVAMMTREGAESAFRELDGFDWGGSVLRLGWGKSMPLPSRPAYGQPASKPALTCR